MADEPNRHSPGATSIEPRHRQSADKTRPDKSSKGGEAWPNEGEGNKTADRDYRKRTEAFVRSGRIEKSARKAAEALDSAEGDELREAEDKGRKGEPARK